MLLRRSRFDDVGYFDERFFLYYEDDDLCLRLFDAKRPIVVMPDVQGGAPFAGVGARSQALAQRVRARISPCPVQADFCPETPFRRRGAALAPVVAVHHGVEHSVSSHRVFTEAARPHGGSVARAVALERTWLSACLHLIPLYP